MPAKLVALTVLILLGLTLSPLVPVDNRRPNSASAQSAKSWLYLNAFQSRKLIAIDPTTGRIEDTIDVDDAGGSLGAAVTSDGKTIITVDGSLKSRLRMFDAATLELIAEHAFDHRLLSRGSGPTVHLTADDRWLLVKTYDDAAAAKGVRVFDIEKRRFVPLGLRNRHCEDPSFASAHDGRLIAACPGVFQELQPLSPNVPNEWISKKIKSSIESPADIALVGDGSVLYAVGYPDASGYPGASGSPEARPPWLLSRWTRGQSEASVVDLRVALNIQGYTPTPLRPSIPALTLSPDGKGLAFVVGPHVWLLDSATLQVVGHWLEPSPVDRPAFSRDGKEILAIRHIGGGRDELIRISTVTRDVTRVPLDHLAMYFHTGVATFIVAPAP